jgi:hypothetical protein
LLLVLVEPPVLVVVNRAEMAEILPSPQVLAL